MSSRDDLAELAQNMKDMLADASKIIDRFEANADAQSKIINEQRTGLTKLNQELVEKDELIRAYLTDEQEWEKKKKEMQSEIEDLRKKAREFKGDAKDSRSVIKELQQVAPEIGSMLDRLTDLEVLLGLDTAEYDDGRTITESGPSVPCGTVVKGVFVCCGSDHYQSKNLDKFSRLKETLPQIDFGSEPVFVLTDSNRPPLPRDVDLVVLYAAGLTHGDTAVIRDESGSTPVFSHNYSLTSLAQAVNKWLVNRSVAVC